MPENTIPSAADIIRVGSVGTGPFSFYGTFNHVINNTFRDYNCLNIRVTHIWGDDYSKNYRGSSEYVRKMLDFWNDENHSPRGIAKQCGIPNICGDFHDMVDEVDAALIMDFDRSFELAAPFLKRGLPVFICSPVAVSVSECEKILDLAEENNAAVFTGAYSRSLLHNVMRNQKIKRGNIASFFAATSFSFYTSYAPDGIEPLYWLIGPGVKKVALHGWNGSSGYDPTGIPVSRIHLEYEQRGDASPIQGVLTLGGYKKSTEWYKVYYRDHSIFEGVTETNWSRYERTLRDFILDIQEVFITNKSLETREDILNKLKILIAAYKSANENNRPVPIDETGDYQLPTVRIEKWDVIPPE
ncbi:MAG: Gfo/Idh/MocA family oxidoreductase [Candidatus Latescibacteria bacterium]|nr:Gfo/Idh/MocA family oxidoreductase [Candidatus Latescibacterota bacterium]